MAAKDSDLHRSKRDLKNTLRSRYSQLRDLLQHDATIDSFSTEMFSSGLTVRRSQDVCGILDEFEAGFGIKTSAQDLYDYYHKFLGVLEKLGGPVQDLALQLRRGGSATPTDNEGCPPQLHIVNPGVDIRENKIEQIAELRNIANKLLEKYSDLVVAVKRSLIDNDVALEDAKLLLKERLKRKARVVPELAHCICSLEMAKNFTDFFNLLSHHCFIGYLNYKLLKKLSNLVKDSEIDQRFDEYEEEYAKLLSATSFKELIPLFDKQSDLSPTAPAGLPYVSFRLKKPWLLTCAYTWVSTFGEFSWSYYAFLSQLRENCIIVTYAILPSVLDDVMRDLSDPVILKKLEDRGVTVFELPQEENDGDNDEVDEISTDSLSEEETSSEDNDSSLDELLVTSVIRNDRTKVKALLNAGANPNYVTETHSGSTCFTLALQKGHTEIVTMLLENGADPNNIFRNKALLFDAIESGDIEIVSAMLSNGARTNVVDKSNKAPLHYAVRTCKVDLVELLINKSVVDLNFTDNYSKTPLFDAIDGGSVEVVNFLLINGARTDVIDKSQRTPLIYAFQREKLELAGILISHGTGFDQMDNHGKTPLHYASEAGRADFVELLLKGNVNVDAKDKNEKTPLMYAVENGNSKAASLLIASGAKIDAVEKYSGKTPLHFACAANDFDLVMYLLTISPDINAIDENKRTPLFYAALSGNADVLHVLIAKGVKTNVVDSDCKTPLHFAGSADVIELLVTECNINVNVMDEFKRTPLFDAIEFRSIEVVNSLLAKGAKTNITDEFHKTPLHYAIERGNVDFIESLIIALHQEKGPKITQYRTPLRYAVETNRFDAVDFLVTKGNAEVNDMDENHRTPLYDAIEQSNTRMVGFLLANGAKTNIIDKSNRSPLSYAIEAGKTNIVELLINEGNADVNFHERRWPPLFDAIQRNNTDIVYLLLVNGARTDAIDNSGYSPIHYACEVSNADIVLLLITKGNADVNAEVCNNNFGYMLSHLSHGYVVTGKTPLHFASVTNKANIVEILIASGADVNSVDTVKNSPIFYAINNKSTEVVKILMDNGANPNVMDIHNKAPLHYATENDNFHIIQLLLSKGNADVNVLDEDHKTPIFNAVWNGNYDVVQMLISHGARADILDKDDKSPLHYACCASLSSHGPNVSLVIQLLVEKFHVDVNAVDKRGMTALQLCFGAYVAQDEDLYRSLGYHSPFTDSFLDHWYMVPNKCVPITLLKLDADPNIKDNEGNNSLHLAVTSTISNRIKDSNDVISELLDARADPNAVNNNGDSSLHVAVRTAFTRSIYEQYEMNLDYFHRQQTELLTRLLQAGADVKIRNKSGMTPLHIARNELSKQGVS